MWTAPGLQDLAQRTDRSDCDHMSGLLSRSHMTAAKMGFRNASSKQEGGMKPPLGRPECLASWDRSITPSAPSSASFGLQREAHCAIAPNVKLRIS
jgi:hypothetical protein